MRTDLLNLIKSNKLFASLDKAGMDKLVKCLHEVNVKKNKFLFLQGQLSDGVYLVMRGKLIAILRTIYHEKKILDEIHAGETIGEIGALSNEPRGASVKALEDSILFKVSCKHFIELCKEYPSMLLQTLDVLATRSRSLLELLSAREPEKKHIALIPAHKDTALEAFATQLARHAHAFEGVTLLSDYDSELTGKYKNLTQIHQHIKELDAHKEKILYVLNGHDTLLAKACFEHVDVLYVVANGHTKPYINTALHKKLHNEELTYKAKPELILIYKDGQDPPRGTIKWLKLANFGMHHHIRVFQENDIQRILRFMTGRAIGVVLGGGGVRSWAHIGALKALKEANIPIDMICGTSGGAVVAGYYALHESFEDITHELSELSHITYKAVSIFHLTWPAVSLFSGEDYTKKQQEIFGKYKIENLWLPYFCVSCNLTKNTAVINNRGKLWKKIRASTAVPGIFPPVVIKGQLHLDGGIINNLPVDLLKKASSSISTIVAVELIHTKSGNKDYNFPPILPLGKTIIAKLKWGYRSYKFPSFVDTFLKSLMAGSSAKQNECAKAADILVSPTLSEFDLLRVTPKQEQKLIKIGYEATLTALNKPKKHKRLRVKHKVRAKHRV